MSTDRFSRTARIASLLSALLIVLSIVACVALAVLGRPDERVTAVDVHDDAGVLDTVLVEEDIAALRTYEPVRVVVWARDGEYSDNINAETLEWARSRPQDGLLSPDGRYWADGLLLLTVSVEQNDGTGSGQVGTYFGEDVKVEPVSAQEDLQSHGYDDFRDRNWEDGVIAIADAAAGEMARPAWTRFGVTYGLPLGVAVLAGLNIAGIQVMRRRFQDADDRFTLATRDVHATVSATEFIVDHGFGGRVKNTAASVLRQYDETLDTRDAIAAAPVRTVTAANVGLWKRIHGVTRTAEDIEDSAGLVRRATALYMGEGNWEEVWTDEVEETASHLRDARDNSDIRRRIGGAAAADLTHFCDTALEQLEAVRARGVAGDGENISECLDEIARIREELTRRMGMIERVSAPANRSLARHVDKAIWQERRRRNRNARSITGFYDRTSFYSPRSFAVGYAVGAKRHRAAEQRKKMARSSGGSNTSFGSSGGGFRGAGSSSRF
ncbi:DUF5129 domain-containing protein [Brevibacterium yomogidense]|uniref:DUF5129 domain-containing protein n=1 Tax=Brevibacterium yomogidense TaxID=946573 RepID=UPI0018DF98E4|nr:DUF5129 domain-containing protein [Brevibacterium yomogidense]